MAMARRASRNNANRGVISVFVGLTLVMFVGLSLLAVQLGLQAVHRFQEHNVSESLAYANAMQVLSQPSPNFGYLVDPTPFVTSNGNPALDTQPVARWQPIYTSTVGPLANTGSYAPIFPTTWDLSGGASVTAQGSARDLFQSGATLFGTAVVQPTVQGAVAVSAVNQVQWTGLRPIPARVILVLDYSKSMKLPYQTCGNATTCAALNVLRTDASGLITTLTAANLNGVVDFGLVLFAEAPGPNPVAPIGYPNELDPVAVQNQANALGATLNTPSMGTQTNLADAINAALVMLGPYDPNDVTQGQAHIIIITDGEPDVCSTGDQGSYAANVVCAEGDAQTVITNAHQNYNAYTYAVLVNPGDIPASQNPDLLQFMAGISGGGPTGATSSPCTLDGTAGDGTSYCTQASYVGDVDNWLKEMFNVNTLRIHCLGQNFFLTNPTSWMASPQITDSMYGYIAVNRGSPAQEAVVTRMLNRTRLDDRVTAPRQFVYNPQPKTPVNGVPINQVIETNAVTCADQINSQTGGIAQAPLFRIRWGLPVIGQTLTVTLP